MTVNFFFVKKLLKSHNGIADNIIFIYKLQIFVSDKLLISWTTDLEIKVNVTVNIFYRILLFLEWNKIYWLNSKYYK